MQLKAIVIGIFFLILAGLTVYYFYPEKALPANVIDRLVVKKASRQMLAYAKGKVIKTYTISLGFAPVGGKQYEGGGKTPEGLYFIDAKNPNSTCHKNLGISYPSAKDIARCKRIGKPTGGDIKIHGLGNGFGFIGKFQRWFDWTSGCIAVTDSEMDELYYAVKVRTPIEIYP